MVRVLGFVFVLFLDRNLPGIYFVLDSLLFCLQVGLLALGHVAPDPWRKILVRQLPERLFEEEFRPNVPHRYGNGRGKEVGRCDRYGACGQRVRSGSQEGRVNKGVGLFRGSNRREMIFSLVHIMFHRCWM